ncbi:XRE family transcriptional regulator [Novosphingobium barchaimii LL02]|uniref:XRE family transcriptional regulator n=1 Tax=Novosphingobium barchaimii LL02 TaxID=1114963 RepID=A0A0J7XXG8_9SPHN|nr:response regulator transcription factor [Novosphingobium barchaimii]KMS56371.1 XRE family transcriptional regulator [Novosphingobium barchaimii LL02]
MSLHILLVEDDRQLQRQLVAQLIQFGHEVQAADDGRKALVLLGQHAFDIVILDWMLPHLDGIELLRQLRESGMNVPVLMLTALGQIPDKLEGFEAGADDYVVKPVDALELNARLHALLRARRVTEQPTDTVSAGDILVSPSRVLAWRGGQALNLSRTEFNLLLELARADGQVVTRAMLIERIWGHDFVPTTNIIDSHVKHLRAKLIQHGDDPIGTVRGIGYQLRA